MCAVRDCNKIAVPCARQVSHSYTVASINVYMLNALYSSAVYLMVYVDVVIVVAAAADFFHTTVVLVVRQTHKILPRLLVSNFK